MEQHKSVLPPKPISITKYLIVAVILGLILLSGYATGFNFAAIAANAGQSIPILAEMCQIDWGYMGNIFMPILDTLRMAVVGTAVGAVVAFFYSFLVVRNLKNNSIAAGVLRTILNIIRCIPDLLLGSIFVAVVGIGILSGTMALAVFSFGMITKLFYEAIETISQEPLEAVTAAGGNKVLLIRYSVLPQVMVYFWNNVLYAFEINVRTSAVLGYVGAGGIGLLLNRALSQLNYGRVGLIVLVVFVVVLVINLISERIRRRLL